MQATANVYIVPSKSWRNADNLCPARLCITHKSKQKYYSLRQKIKDNDWLFIPEEDITKIFPEKRPDYNGQRARGKYKDIRHEYDRIVREAEQVINKIAVFSFGKFEFEFLNTTSSSWDNFFNASFDYIKALHEDERFGYASSYESMLRALWEYHNNKRLKYDGKPITNRVKVEQRLPLYLAGKQLNFVDITPVWLKSFDKWMQKDGKSKSTIGIYMRNIRVLFNIAIKKHKIKADYPFNEYKPKTSSGRKMALSAHQIRLIADYVTEDPIRQYYKDLFMFSFLANGMNLSDIARLRQSNIDNGKIYFVREKTKGKDEQTEIKVPITKQMQNIIDRHSVKSIGHDAYIFPILRDEWPEKRKFMQTKQAIKMVNLHIREIAKAVKVPDKVSSYTARHSWATIAKNSGTSTEYIKEALGHSNVMVTESYLKSFEDTTRREHSDKIENLVFKKA